MKLQNPSGCQYFFPRKRTNEMNSNDLRSGLHTSTRWADIVIFVLFVGVLTYVVFS